MGVTETRQILVFVSKIRKLLNNNCELWQEHVETAPQEQKIRIICYITRSISALIEIFMLATVSLYVAPQ